MKRLLLTDKVLRNKNGQWLGYEVIETEEAFTDEELASSTCPECGGANGFHKSCFHVTGASGFGDVDGYSKECSQKGYKITREKV